MFVFAVTFHCCHLAHIQFTKVIPFYIKIVTIYLSAYNFAVISLYKEIKFKPDVQEKFETFERKCRNKNLNQCMRFPTIWFVRPAKPQISLRIRAV